MSFDEKLKRLLEERDNRLKNPIASHNKQRRQDIPNTFGSLYNHLINLSKEYNQSLNKHFLNLVVSEPAFLVDEYEEVIKSGDSREEHIIRQHATIIIQLRRTNRFLGIGSLLHERKLQEHDIHPFISKDAYSVSIESVIASRFAFINKSADQKAAPVDTHLSSIDEIIKRDQFDINKEEGLREFLEDIIEYGLYWS